MSKKGFFGGSSSDDEKSTAQGTQDDRTKDAERRAQQADDVNVPHRNIIDDARNVETDDDSVNPHNEAMAQKPVAVPKDRTHDPRSDKLSTTDDLKSAFRDWGKKLRLGGPSSADWERFEELTGDRQPRPQDKPISSVPEGAAPAAPDAVSSTSGEEGSRSKSKGA